MGTVGQDHDSGGGSGRGNGGAGLPTVVVSGRPTSSQPLDLRLQRALEGDLMNLRRFVQWTCSSLVGHLVLFGLTFTVPICLLGMLLNYSEGTLTWDWAPFIALYSALGGVASAVIIWFTITSPLRQKYRGRQKNQGVSIHDRK